MIQTKTCITDFFFICLDRRRFEGSPHFQQQRFSQPGVFFFFFFFFFFVLFCFFREVVGVRGYYPLRMLFVYSLLNDQHIHIHVSVLRDERYHAWIQIGAGDWTLDFPTYPPLTKILDPRITKVQFLGYRILLDY